VVPRRLARLPAHPLGAGLVVHEAATSSSRLAGLALLPGLPRGHALLLRRCRSVHTFGMRFPIDVVFADERGTVVRLVRDVSRGRVLRCPGATDVLETRAGEAPLFLEGGRGAGARLSRRIPRAGRGGP
jgi:uncharacterized protein